MNPIVGVAVLILATALLVVWMRRSSRQPDRGPATERPDGVNSPADVATRDRLHRRRRRWAS